MKKVLSGILILMVCIMTACSGTSETNNGPQKENNGSKDEKYVLKVSHGHPPTSHQHKLLEWYNDEISKRSNGRLSLEIYPSGQLMPSGQELQAMLNGQIDMAIPISSVIGSIDPIWYLFELPYLFEFDNDDPSVIFKHKRAFFDSEKGGGVIKAKTEEHGLKVLSMSQDYYSSFFTADKDKMITDLKSAKGLKIRSTGGTILNDTIEALGASASVVDPSEVVTAIQQGVIDGVTTTAFYALANYPIKTWTSAPMNNYTLTVMMSQKKFQTLPADLQEILVETGKDLDKYLDEISLAAIKEIYEKGAKEKGVEVYFPTKKEHDEFKEVLVPLQAKWAKTVEDGQELLHEVENTRP
ncbi:TRAP transporter substrate-binding protein [Neobacillus sp. YX16]|uniref:TRAP transporter substrate-binding protein n=1 Tax=Neobacillus sp. YX16 TaxID=3047874 RepID=UPI0024C2A801|nr:TRAP transporter substrate-binding protein [Neobacillus sp. YX16]WHZ00830.1 TRAP transporter substrate-binding protein [Neobacillus sp. YX16]